MKPLREEILGIVRAYYDAGHIVDINADVLAHKITDMIELYWDQYGRQRSAITTESSGWVIERYGCYWDGRGRDTFVSSRFHLEAVRFARKQDAERVLEWSINEALRTACAVIEHVWIGDTL